MKRKEPEKKVRLGSLAFVLSIPIYFFLGIVAVLSILVTYDKIGLNSETLKPFGAGAFLGLLFCWTLFPQRLRTTVHELKHTAVILLTGNKLKNIHIERVSGHVTYNMYEDRLHFEAFIALAPYCFPLLSLPVFIGCIIFEQAFREVLCVILGAALTIDLISGIGDIHPYQTDLKRIFGGFLFFGSFIGGVNFFWTATCLLWVLAGNAGFFIAANFIATFVGNLLTMFENHIRKAAQP